MPYCAWLGGVFMIKGRPQEICPTTSSSATHVLRTNSHPNMECPFAYGDRCFHHKKGHPQATPRFLASSLFRPHPPLMPVFHLPHSILFPLLPSQSKETHASLSPLVEQYFNGHPSPFPGRVPTTVRVPLSPLSYSRHKLPPLVEDGLHCLLSPS